MADERIIKHCSQGRNTDKILSPLTGLWSDCPTPLVDPGFACYQVSDDFVTLALGDATSKWTMDFTGAGGSLVLGDAQTAAVGLGGVVLLVTGTSTINDYRQIKATSTNTGAPFKITKDSGKKLWFECRFKIDDVDQLALYIGLNDPADEDIANDADGLYAGTEFVGFRALDDVSTELDWIVDGGATTDVKPAIATLVDDTWIDVGFKFDGANSVTPYINGTAQPYTVAADETNFPHDHGLTPAIVIKETEAALAGKTLYVDWIKCVQER